MKFHVGKFSGPQTLDLALNWALEYHTLIFFLNGTNMKYKFILFTPWLLKSPVNQVISLNRLK